MTLEEAKKNIQERMNILLKRYGEWKDAHPGWFASGELIGQVEGLEEAMGILDDVDTEPVVKDKLTLTELAIELRKIFNFRYLTYDRRGDDWYVINLWISKPVYQSDVWWPKKHDEWLRQVSIDRQALRPEIELDLSEYPDINGLTDYSRCIVEVTDASE